jgi:hypothetical protein
VECRDEDALSEYKLPTRSAGRCVSATWAGRCASTTTLAPGSCIAEVIQALRQVSGGVKIHLRIHLFLYGDHADLRPEMICETHAPLLPSLQKADETVHAVEMFRMRFEA